MSVDTLRAFESISSERQLAASKGDAHDDALVVGTSAIAVAGALSRPSPLCRAYRTHDSNLAERLSDLLSDRTQPTVAGGTSSGERQVIRDTEKIDTSEVLRN